MAYDVVKAHPNGAAGAAILAACIGLFLFGVVVFLSEWSVAVKDVVFALGRAWIPGAEGIGPYSGKETVLLIGWFAAWGALHLAWRHREVTIPRVLGLAMVLLLVAVLLVWPPVWHMFV